MHGMTDVWVPQIQLFSCRNRLYGILLVTSVVCLCDNLTISFLRCCERNELCIQPYSLSGIVSFVLGDFIFYCLTAWSFNITHMLTTGVLSGFEKFMPQPFIYFCKHSTHKLSSVEHPLIFPIILRQINNL